MRRHLMMFCVLAACYGCGGDQAAQPVYDPTEYQGEVDTSLPPELQEKQEALKRVFDELQRRTGYDSLPDVLPDYRLTETRESFFGNTLALEKWDFNGRPSGNDVPVVVQLLEDTPEESLRKEERVYTVTGSMGKYVIQRKQ